MNRPKSSVPSSRSLIALGLLVAAALCAGGGCSYEQSADEKQFFSNLGGASISVYPAFVRNRSGENVYDKGSAERLAAWLNENKLAEARVVDEQPPITGPVRMDESRMWRESRDALSAYVKAHPPQTTYALIAEYIGVGDGRREVAAVHCYVLTRDGAYAYGVGQNSHHEPFRSIHPRTIDDCTRVVLEQMRTELIDARKSAPDSQK